MKLTKVQIEEAVVTIYAKLIEGQTDIEIADDMGLTIEQYKNLKRAMFDVKAEELRTKPREHVYIEHLIDQMQNIKALSDIIDKFEETKQFTAVVGAIRTRADLTKSMIQMGQEFGIIHKEPEKRQIIAGVTIAELTNDKLRQLVLGKVGEFNKLCEKFSDADFKTLDAPKDIYFEGKEEPIKVEGKDVELTDGVKKIEPPRKKKRTKSKSLKVIGDEEDIEKKETERKSLLEEAMAELGV